MARDRFERLERFAQRRFVAALFGRAQPYLTERGVHARVIMEALHRAAQGSHRRVWIADPRIGESHRDQTLRPRSIERRQRFELVDFVPRISLQPVHLRQLVARRNECRGNADRLFERRARFGQLPAIVQAEPEHIESLGERRVQPHGVLKGGNGARQTTIPA